MRILIIIFQNNPASSCFQAFFNNITIVSTKKICSVRSLRIWSYFKIVVGSHHIEKFLFLQSIKLKVNFSPAQRFNWFH